MLSKTSVTEMKFLNKFRAHILIKLNQSINLLIQF